MSRIKSIGQNILLVAVSILVSLILFEIGVRTFLPQKVMMAKKEPPHPKNMYVANKDIGYSLAPGFKGNYKTPEFKINISINSEGLRDHEYKEKKKNEYRVLVLGDSFVFGWGVEQENTFVKELERILNKEKGDKDYEVINVGILGYGTEQELKYLREKGMKYNPDLVLLGFYIGNDIKENLAGNFNNRVVKDGYLFDKRISELYKKKLESAGKNIDAWKIPIPFKSFFLKNSQAYTLLHNRYNKILIKLGVRKDIDITKDLMREEYNIFLRDLNSEKYKRFSQDVNQKWNLTIKLLKELSVNAKSEGVNFAIILIPTNYQVYQEKFREITDLYLTNFDLTLPNKKISEFARENHDPIIDLLPKFIDAGKTEELYFSKDGHWNEKGHKLAARLIYEELVRQSILN